MTLLLSAAIIAFAFFIQFLMGFGGGMISIPMLSLFMPIADAVSFVMLFQFLTGVAIFTMYKDVDWKKILILIPSSMIGILIGIFSLKYINDDYVRIFLAAFIFIYLIKSQLGKDYIGAVVKVLGVHGSGLIGGLISGLVGMGAPFYVVFFKESGCEGKTFRANMIVILFLTYLMRVPISVGIGFIDMALFKNFMLVLPAFVIAAFAGQKLHVKVPEHLFQTVTDLLLFVSALSLLVKALT